MTVMCSKLFFILLIISWKCELYSACHYTPSIPGVYYLTLEIHGISPKSYCTVNNQFQIALINIPYPFSYDIATALSTCAACFLILASYLYYDREILGLASKSLSAKRKLNQKNPTFKGMTMKYLQRFDSILRGDVQAPFQAVNNSPDNDKIGVPLSSKKAEPRKGSIQLNPNGVFIVKSAKFADPDPIEDSDEILQNSSESRIDEDPTQEEQKTQEQKKSESIEKSSSPEPLNQERSGVEDAERSDSDISEEISEDEDEALLDDAEMELFDGLTESNEGDYGAQVGDLNISVSSLNKFLAE